MTNVQLSLAKDAEFQNLVVKNQSSFAFGAFNKLQAGILDAEEANFGTLTVQTLNASNSIGNPFAGLSLTPNELVALTSTKSLTTYPYSPLDVENTAVQRSGHGIQADLLGVLAQSNQLVLGTGKTVTINAVANGAIGGFAFGSTVSAAQLVLSGPASIVNVQPLSTQIVINEGDNPNACQLRILTDAPAGQTAGIEFSQGGTPGWSIAAVDLGFPLCRLQIQPGSLAGGGTPAFQFNLGANGAIELQNGNLLPLTNNQYNLGSAANRWLQLYLTTQALTSVGGAANFTTNPASGLGTTTSLTTAAQSSSSITFTNTNRGAQTAVFVACSAYGGTTGIPMFQYSNSSTSVVLINAHTSAALNGTATFSFVLYNAVGTG